MPSLDGELDLGLPVPEVNTEGATPEFVVDEARVREGKTLDEIRGQRAESA